MQTTITTTALRPTVLPPGAGTDLWILSDRMTTKLGPEHTSGAFVVGEIRIPAGGGPPPHVHTREDEMFLVLDGELRFLLGSRTFRGAAGSCVYLPKGVPHTFKNVGTGTARFLAFATPCGFERFAASVGSTTCPPPGPSDAAVIRRLVEIAPEFGIDMNPKFDGPLTDVGDCPDGDCRWVLGESVTIKLTSADTNGNFTVAELKSWPGGGPPPHVHREQDEMFYVREGIYDFLLDGATQTHGPGTLVWVPRGTPHTYRNAGNTIGRLLDVHTPGGFEAFFEEAGIPAPDRVSRPTAPAAPTDRQAIIALLDRHGMDLAGD
jgi:quercetin dioxygenase-like cupin family protein